LVTPHGLLEAERGTESGSESGKNFSKERTHTRYAYDTVVETHTAHADALSRLSVAVFLDAKKVSLAQSKLVTELVRASAGADLTNDQVIVAELPFWEQSPLVQPRHLRAERLAAITFPVILGIAITAYLLRRARGRPRRTPEDQAAEQLKSSLQNEMPQTVAYVLGTLPARVRDHVLSTYTSEQRLQIVAHMNGRVRD
jgi:flagellar biosynthesis/type III secretory pathway M-ring protein FliF/YscJ